MLEHGAMIVVHRYICACGINTECLARQVPRGWWLFRWGSDAAVPACSEPCAIAEMTAVLRAQPVASHTEFEIQRGPEVTHGGAL